MQTHTCPKRSKAIHKRTTETNAAKDDIGDKGLFINDVINFGGYRDPPPPPRHHSSLFGYPPSSRA